MTEPSRRPLTDALIPELEKLWEDASGRAEYVEISMIALDARDLARELAEAKRALSDVNRWIPVGERKPEDGQVVLGYWAPSAYHPGSMEALTYLAADAPDRNDAWRDWEDEDQDEPSHWMPLPEAPK